MSRSAHLRATIPASGWFREATWSPDGGRLLLLENGYADIWRLDRVEPHRVTTIRCDFALDRWAWSPDGRFVAGPDRHGEALAVYDAATGEVARRPVVIPCRGPVAWSPATNTLAIATTVGWELGVLWLEEAGEGACREIPLPGGGARPLVVVGQRMATCVNGEAFLLEDGRARMVPLPDRLRGHGVAGTPDGRLLALGDEGRVLLVDVATRRRVGVLDWPGTTVLSVSWSADGRRLAARSADNTRVWTFGDDTVHHIDLYAPTGPPVRQISVAELHPSDPFVLAASHPDGSRLDVWTLGAACQGPVPSNDR